MLQILPDNSHTLWNDTKNALKGAGLWTHTLLLVLLCNMSHGPWEEARWFRMLKAATTEFVSQMDHTDPLFVEFIPHILRDRQEEDRSVEPHLGRKLFAELGESWHVWKKGEKVALSRFFGVFKSAAPVDEIWHQKLLSLIYLGLHAGWLTEGKFCELARAKQRIVVEAHPEDETERVRMQQSSKDLKALRKAAKNTLHLATLFLSDPSSQMLTRVMLVAVRPVQDYHHKQNIELRSCSGALKWLVEQVVDGTRFENLLVKILQCSQDAAALEYIGITVGRNNSIVDGHPRLLLETGVGKSLMLLLFQLVWQRARRLSFFWVWPTKALLMCSKAEVAQQCMDVLKKDHELLGCAKVRTEAFWKALVKRSPFELATVQQLLSMSRLAEWKVNDALVNFLRSKYCALVQSQVDEDGFQRLRRKEDSAINRHCVSPYLLQRCNTQDAMTHVFLGCLVSRLTCAIL